MRVAKATTKDGRAVGDVPEDGAQVWALTKTGKAVAGTFTVWNGDGMLIDVGKWTWFWADILTWAAVPKLTTKDNGDLIMADLPF